MPNTIPMSQLVRESEIADRGKPRCEGCGTTRLETPDSTLCPWCESLDTRYAPLTSYNRGNAPKARRYA